MTLKEIKYLLVVARCASISEAAKQIYVAQPSLTHAIQSVEKEVGFQIFQRGRSGVTVTERGEEFLGDIRTVYEQMAMVQGKYVEKRPERKVFSISMQHYSMAGAAFARFLRDLEEPYYNAQILEGRMADVIADVAAGRSEIGFVHFADDKEPAMIKTLHNEQLEFYGITHTQPCVLLRRDHPLCSLEQVESKDLAPYPLVVYESGGGASYVSEEGVLLLQADRQIVVNDSLMLVRMLESTQACAVGLPLWDPVLEERRGIVTRPLADGKPLWVGWIKKADTVLRPLARRYLQTLNQS